MTTATINAVTASAPGAAPELREDAPAPAPTGNEVLVRVHASSVNPVDAAIAAGQLTGMVEHEYPVTLGRDYAGIVEQVGPDVTRYAVGDEVFGFLMHANPTVRDGSWAELITVGDDRSIATAPAGVDIAVAGAAPLAGIAAMLSVDGLALSEGDVVLIVGATGGVGSLAVQLAKKAGATVIAPARPEDEDYLRSLGVSEIVPRDGDVVAAVRERHREGVDALLDLVSYAPGAFDGALGDGGRVTSTNGAAGEGPGRTNVMADPSTENLDRLGELLTDGALRVPVHATYALAQAADGLAALASPRHGKLAVRVA
jgi:NADPH2:quinone reductase